MKIVMEILSDPLKIITPTIFVIVAINAIIEEELPKYQSIRLIKIFIEAIFEDKNLFGMILSVFEMIITVPVWIFFIYYDSIVFSIRSIFFIWNAGNKKNK